MTSDKQQKIFDLLEKSLTKEERTEFKPYFMWPDQFEEKDVPDKVKKIKAEIQRIKDEDK
jgi:hypothetical protein